MIRHAGAREVLCHPVRLQVPQPAGHRALARSEPVGAVRPAAPLDARYRHDGLHPAARDDREVHHAVLLRSPELRAVQYEGVQARPVQDLDGRDGASFADLGHLDLSALEELLDEGAGRREAVRVDEGEDLEGLPGGGFPDGHLREHLGQKGGFGTHSFSFRFAVGVQRACRMDSVLLCNAARCQRLTARGRHETFTHRRTSMPAPGA